MTELGKADRFAGLKDTDNMTVRKYNAETDEAMVAEWWEHRHGDSLQTKLLPPVGVVVEDEDGEPACAAWLYLSVSHGVCFPEWCVSRPGLSLKEATIVFRYALLTLERIALALDYNVMMCNTLPPIARTMKRMGWQFSDRTKITGLKVLTHQN